MLSNSVENVSDCLLCVISRHFTNLVDQLLLHLLHLREIAKFSANADNEFGGLKAVFYTAALFLL